MLKTMKVLAIETSCDDTCIALAECSTKDFKLLSNIISSQVEIHRKWGGVYPALARREHQRNLAPLLQKCLKEARLLKSKIKNQKSKIQIKNQNLKEILGREETLHKQLKEFLNKYQKPKIDLIAVTVGPGLAPCLWTGVNFAKALAHYWNLPIMGINHIEAHILANWLTPLPTLSPLPQGGGRKRGGRGNVFPAISLIVSGGHTQLILIKKLGDYKILGETRDDAAGEAFDKIARILGLPYPGGPAVAAEAKKISIINDKLSIKLPRPMLHSKNYDFSFSGLKTAVLYDYKKRKKSEKENKGYVRAMACEAQQAIIDILIKKTIKAAKDYNVKSIFLGGGVAANEELRRQFQQKIKKEKLKFKFHISDFQFCTDNAAMVAATACSKVSQKQFLKNWQNWQKIEAKPNLRISD